MSSFVKKINTAPQLYKTKRGVKSAGNGQYHISTGNPSLDEVIGGGLIVGSLVVLYEDNSSQYYNHFLKTYLGEGIVQQHKSVIIDPEPVRGREHWLKFLPAASLVTKKQEPSEESKQQIDKLKVAWRYNDLLEEKMLGQNQIDSKDEVFRFDNSKPMGDSLSNQKSYALKREELLI